MKNFTKRKPIADEIRQFLWLLFASLFFLNLSMNTAHAQKEFDCGTDHVEHFDVTDPEYISFKKKKLEELNGENSSGNLSVLINFHIMQTSGSDPSASFTNEPDQMDFVCAMVNYVNWESFDNAGLLESCGDNLSCHPFSDEEYIQGTEMLNTGIEFILNKVVFHQDDSALDNFGFPIGSGTAHQMFIDQYLEDGAGNPLPEYCDAINVYLTEGASGASGMGTNGVVSLDGVFTQHFPGNAPWDISGTLGHEIGHVLGLSHPFSRLSNGSRPHNPNANPSDHVCTQEDTDGSGGLTPPWALTSCWRGGSNLMMGYGRIKRYITPDGIGIMQSNLCNGAQQKFVDDTPCGTVIFTQDYTIEEDEIEFYCGDVIVRNGATLTVKGNMFFRGSWNPDFAGITVENGSKVLIDGGLITTCSGYWKGIRIKDFSTGQVEMINSGTIEWARFGIAKNEAGGTAQGLITIDGGIFRDCRVGIAFVGHNSTPSDPSTIVDCHFLRDRSSHVFNGITMFRMRLLNEVDFCTFRGQSDNGILAIRSFVNVENSTFRSIGSVGINLERSRSTIDNNGFRSIDRCIQISGPSFYEIMQNRFGSSNIGLHVTSTSTGVLGSGEVHNNWFNNFGPGQTLNKGIVAEGVNISTHITKNCFGSFDVDIEVNGNGIHREQGTVQDRAGNCFTNNGVPSIINNSTLGINYHTNTNPWIDRCWFPDLLIGNVNLVNSTQGSLPSCVNFFADPGDDPDPLPEFCDCDFFFLTDKSTSVDSTEFNEMECAIKETINEIDSLCGGDCRVRFGSGSFTGFNDDPVLDNEFQCDSLKNIGPDRSGGTNLASGLCGLLTWLDSGAADPTLDEGQEYDPECLKVILHTDAGCGNFDDKVKCGDDYLSVNELIDSLETNYGAEISIVHYTNYDADGNPINPLEDCEDANQAATDSTGVIIESEFDCEGNAGDIIDSLRIADNIQYLASGLDYKHPDNGLESEIALTANIRTGNEMKISPNPFNTVLNIEMDMSSEYEILITNNLSQRIFSTRITDGKSLRIDAQEWTPGIYFVNCEDKINERSWTQKVIMTAK